MTAEKDIATCATLLPLSVCSVLDYLHYGLSWFILLGTAVFLFIRIKDRFFK